MLHIMHMKAGHAGSAHACPYIWRWWVQWKKGLKADHRRGPAGYLTWAWLVKEHGNMLDLYTWRINTSNLDTIHVIQWGCALPKGLWAVWLIVISFVDSHQTIKVWCDGYDHLWSIGCKTNIARVNWLVVGYLIFKVVDWGMHHSYAYGCGKSSPRWCFVYKNEGMCHMFHCGNGVHVESEHETSTDKKSKRVCWYKICRSLQSSKSAVFAHFCTLEVLINLK